MLWVVALLTVIAGEFCFAIRTETTITRNYKEETQAHYIAVSGLYWTVGGLVVNEYVPRRMQPSSGEAEKEDVRWRINADIPAVPFGEGQFKVEKDNESGKINLNRASEPLLRLMLSQFDLQDREKNIIVDSILDWRDRDHLHRINGAENDYYQALPEPYSCRNGDFTSIGELLLVRGVTPELFHGGLKDMVSVYQDKEADSTATSAARTAEADFNRINVNAASPRMLRALPRMTDELVGEIIKFREKTDFQSLSDLQRVVGTEIYAAISPYVTLRLSPYYTIRSVGMLNDSRVRRGVQAVVKIDRTLAKGYEIIQWIDGLEYRS